MLGKKQEKREAIMVPVDVNTEIQAETAVCNSYDEKVVGMYFN